MSGGIEIKEAFLAACELCTEASGDARRRRKREPYEDVLQDYFTNQLESAAYFLAADYELLEGIRDARSTGLFDWGQTPSENWALVGIGFSNRYRVPEEVARADFARWCELTRPHLGIVLTYDFTGTDVTTTKGHGLPKIKHLHLAGRLITLVANAGACSRKTLKERTVGPVSTDGYFDQIVIAARKVLSRVVQGSGTELLRFAGGKYSLHPLVRIVAAAEDRALTEPVPSAWSQERRRRNAR